jgi:hypothetical protein
MLCCSGPYIFEPLLPPKTTREAWICERGELSQPGKANATEHGRGAIVLDPADPFVVLGRDVVGSFAGEVELVRVRLGPRQRCKRLLLERSAS